MVAAFASPASSMTRNVVPKTCAKPLRMLGLGAALATWLTAGAAGADPIRSNDYTLDLFQGPVLAPLRVTGIAGAYAGYAEGIAGFVSNAAAPAVRPAYSVRYVDFDVSASLSIPLDLFDNNDFDNSGDIDYDYSTFIYANLGGLVAVGPYGIGIFNELSRYTVEASDGQDFNVLVGKHVLLVGWSSKDGGVSVGSGVRALTVGVDAGAAQLTLAGVAPELGFLAKPINYPFRAGLTWRFPVEAIRLGDAGALDPDGTRRVAGFAFPNSAVLPWELELGFVFQAGPRPLNPKLPNPADHVRAVREQAARRIRAREAEKKRVAESNLSEGVRIAWEDAHAALDPIVEDDEDDWLYREEDYLRDQRLAEYESLPREKLLFTTALLITGAVEDGVSVERFLSQQNALVDNRNVIGSSGRYANFSIRAGIEAEPITDRLATRLGTYYEPNRFGGVGRQHFTFGADLKLFTTDWFGLVGKTTYALLGAMDVAPRYESLSVSIGVWH